MMTTRQQRAQVVVRETILAIYFALFASCAASSLSRYDVFTYKGLTDLRPIAMRVYASFEQPTLDRPRIEAFEIQLDQLLEYEQWKGAGNQDMVDQLRELREMFQDHLADRTQSGPWSQAHLENKRQLFLEAIQIAIETETAKNPRPE